MMNAEAMQMLLDKGLTGEDILEVARALEGGRRPRVTIASDPVVSEMAGPLARWGYAGPITPRLPDKEWWPLRNAVLERDGHTCRYCGERAERMCADHVVPLSRGGSNESDNLVACCIPCNSSKADKLLDEWEGRLYA